MTKKRYHTTFQGLTLIEWLVATIIPIFMINYVTVTYKKV